MKPKAGREGRSLLAGLLRWRSCGRMLHVTYVGTHGDVPRYHFRGAQINHGEDWCISFGGLAPDRAVAAEILKVEANTVETAIEAATRLAKQQEQRRQAWSLELEQARYEAHLAARRDEAVDPENRLVAGRIGTAVEYDVANGGWVRVALTQRRAIFSRLKFRIEELCTTWHTMLSLFGMYLPPTCV